MKENVDYVAFTGGDQSSWYFFIKGTARTAYEESCEILDLAKEIFEVTSGFYKPTRIVYDIKIRSPDTSVYELVTDRMRSKTVQMIYDNKGLTFNKLADDFCNIEANSMAKYIGGIYFTHGKTLFSLNGRDEFVDSNTKELYLSHIDSEIVSPLPNSGYDPIVIDLFHDRLKGEDEVVDRTDTAYYSLVFHTNTSMWFEDTEIGEENRLRLKDLFDRVYARFSIVHAAFLSDHFSDTVLGLKS